MDDPMVDDEWRGYVKASLEGVTKEFKEVKDALTRIEERQRIVETSAAKTAGVVAVIISLLAAGVSWAIGGGQR